MKEKMELCFNQITTIAFGNFKVWKIWLEFLAN